LLCRRHASLSLFCHSTAEHISSLLTQGRLTNALLPLFGPPFGIIQELNPLIQRLLEFSTSNASTTSSDLLSAAILQRSNHPLWRGVRLVEFLSDEHRAANPEIPYGTEVSIRVVFFVAEAPFYHVELLLGG
jgi:hypothetical protein